MLSSATSSQTPSDCVLSVLRETQFRTHIMKLRVLHPYTLYGLSFTYVGWNFNFGNTPLDRIQELLE